MTLTNIIAVQSLPAPTHASYVKQRPKVLLTLGLIQGTLKYMHWVQCTTSIYALFESGVRKLNKEAGLDAICHCKLGNFCQVQQKPAKKLFLPSTNLSTARSSWKPWSSNLSTFGCWSSAL